MNDNLIERTEKLLNGITPGEWRASMHNGITYDDGSSSFQCGIYPAQVKGLAPVLLTNNIDRRNAEFIAAAPELARELLAEVKRLRDVMDELTDVLYVPTDEIVDAVRRRLTPRVIETRDQLKALPVGSIVLEDGSDGFVMESYWDEIWQMPKWLYPGDDDPQTEPTLPATVLHTPEGGDL